MSLNTTGITAALNSEEGGTNDADLDLIKKRPITAYRLLLVHFGVFGNAAIREGFFEASESRFC